VAARSFWDYGTGYNFQEERTRVQPGSLESEAGILGAVFDHSGSRLITCEADKTVKMWREDPDATEEGFPIDMAAWTDYVRKSKEY
jgi:pleiotropic regulator 1